MRYLSREPRVAWAGDSPAHATRGSRIHRSPLEYRARGFAVRPARIFEQKRDCSQSKKAHTTGAYPGFRSMKQLRVLPLPHGRDASPSQGHPPADCRQYPFIHLGGERQCGAKYLV